MLQKLKNIYHLANAFLANMRYGFPSHDMTVVGITGTDGKTTTVSLIYHILKTAGKDVSMISTVGATINKNLLPVGFHVTNPSPFPLQKFIAEIKKTKKAKKQYLVLEVTSHGIDQNRIFGIPFSIAGITNVSHEHLDYHKTYDNYLTTKAKLLQKATVAVINKDDKSYAKLEKMLADKKVLTYGITKKADIMPNSFAFKTSLPGLYNKYNILLATTICQQLGISDSVIKKAIASYHLPVGRTDIVYKKDFLVMIDFAHTPNALEQLLPTLRMQTKGKLIHVFGSAGRRDVTKRPLMGKIASQYDNTIFLTAEDPRDESLSKIMQEIKNGINKQKDITVWTVPDRQKAIDEAIAVAQKGDMVVITGKGHEASMNYGQGEVTWSDYTAVEKALEKRKNKKIVLRAR